MKQADAFPVGLGLKDIQEFTQRPFGLADQFEPPQEKWMQDHRVLEMVKEAKRKLVEEKVLKPSVLNRSVKPHSAHAGQADDWRYLAAAAYL